MYSIYSEKIKNICEFVFGIIKKIENFYFGTKKV